ncbi:hypothetical protein [Streptomyces sp. NPDC059828]|uniref:hypothetical protein n=1 Tax=Streptomyces sp. NPDC059828 TaxID=3346965 RepID=UPI003661BCF0
MSESQVAAVLSRHWKMAVLAAAGFATVAATTTFVAVNHREAVAGARSSTAHADGKGLPAGGGGDSGGKGKEGHGKEGGGAHDKGGKKHDDKYGGHHGDDATYVKCDPNDLIANLVDLNADSGGELVLAKDCTYTLTVNQDGNGLPVIVQPITIHGNGATIQRAADIDQFRFFQVAAGGELKLSHLSLTRGETAEDQDGGAIQVDAAGRLTLDRVNLEDNTVDSITGDDGGAINNEGITDIRRSTFRGNSAQEGGAILNDGGKLRVEGSKLTRNLANAGGGAIGNRAGTVLITKSLISANHANDGGGLNASGLLELEDSAVIDNTAVNAGGIISFGALYVRHSTVSGNIATDGPGGIFASAAGVIEDSKVNDNANAGTSGTGGGVRADGELSIRRSEVVGNQAPGNGAVGGGVYVNSGATLRLTDSKVKRNISDEPAGGVHNLGTVITYGKVRIIDNVPTNCQATGTNPVPNCFG